MIYCANFPSCRGRKVRALRDQPKRLLVFIRTKTSPTPTERYSTPIFIPSSSNGPPIEAGEMVVIPHIRPDSARPCRSIFGRDHKPDWVLDYEVVEIGANTACAPPRRDAANMLMDAEAELVEYKMGRQCQEAERFLHRAAIFEQPIFGRKSAIILFAPGNSDRDTDWASQRITSELGSDAVKGWRGELFMLVCFFDERSPDVIAESMRKVLRHRHVDDYMIFQLASVAVPREKGLSPVEEWCKRKRSQQSDIFKIPDHKTSQSGKTIQVLTRWFRLPKQQSE